MPDALAALATFEAFEGRFAAQARVSILLAGLSGAYMLYKLQCWSWLFDPAHWWLMLMVVIWLVFRADGVRARAACRPSPVS